MLLSRWFVVLLWLGLLPIGAATAEELRVCMTDVPHSPWRIADADGRLREQGLDFWLLRQFARRSGWTFTVQRTSGRRCIQELVEGRSDAILGFSYLPERAHLVRYPMKGGQPDDSLALRLDSYSWYVRRAAKPSWDGERLALPAQVQVAAQAGHSIVSVLAAQGYRVDDSARSVMHSLDKVLRGHAAAAAVPTLEGDRELQANPDLGRQLRRLDPPVSVRAYHLVFAHGFAGRHEQELPALWRQFHELAHSSAYHQAYRDATRTP